MSFVALSLLAVSLAGQAQDDCRYTDERNATIDAAAARRLVVDAGAGSLKIIGKAGQKNVVIRGKACASSKEVLDRIKLDSRRDGNTIEIEANIQREDDSRYGWRDNHYATLDVVMEVPEGIAGDITDGSGEMELQNLGDLEVHDGSGEFYAENVGALRLEDGSGEIEIVNARGNVSIRDGSGEIKMRDVKGSVTVRDGSGSISARRVAGDFIVADDGSGGVDYEDVRGRVDVPRRKHGRDY